MKKILLPFLAVMLLLVSCSSDDNAPEVRKEVFYGKLLLNSYPVLDDAKCTLDIVGDSAAITLHGVTFHPAMPAMDIVVPALDCEKRGGMYVISGNDIVPTVMGNPMDMYRMTSVEATLNGDEFVVSAVTAMGTIGFSNVVSVITPVVGDRSFKGELISGDFAKEIVIDVTADRDLSAMDIVLNDVKFAANMPLVLDITLKDIPYVENNGVITFEAKDVAPYMNTETTPAAAYMFSAVQGEISGGKLLFSARMAENLAPYVAGMEFVFSGNEVVE